MARTWILTGSPENQVATREHGFAVIGLRERNRKWPAEHWTLVFQGQIRPIPDHDASMWLNRMSAATGAWT